MVKSKQQVSSISANSGMPFQRRSTDSWESSLHEYRVMQSFFPGQLANQGTESNCHFIDWEKTSRPATCRRCLMNATAGPWFWSLEYQSNEGHIIGNSSWGKN
jgi:hypothetical protein